MAQLPRQIGPYVIEGRLGAGNMGVVFRVRHAQLDARYALKVLRTDLGGPQDLARFQREIELVAVASGHPHVVGIHTAAHEQGRLYYVMDLIEGEDLQAKVDRGPLPPRQAARYARDLARALAFLHARGIVHRDVKPSNVLVDAQDQPRLSDFGLARAFTDDQQRLTRTGELIGTPYYMSPEQARGQRVGPEADVYALGMLLHTLLAGRPAVVGNTALEVIDRIRQGKLEPLAQAAPTTPAALATSCARALAPDPARRPSAEALADELDLFLGGGGAGPTAGQAGRHRRGVVALVLLLVLVGGGLLAWRQRGGAAATDAPVAGSVDPVALVRQQVAAGEAACEAGDLQAARHALQAAEALIETHGGAELRGLRRQGLAGLRAGIELLAPDADDGYDLADALRDLARARELAPEAPHLIAWRVRAAVALGRPGEAVEDLRAAAEPDRIPAVERAAVWLAAGDVAQAEALVAQVADPGRAAELRYALGLLALDAERWEAARAHLGAAVAAAPGDPRRERARRSVALALERASGWSRGGDPGLVGNALRREVDVALVAAAIDPGFALDRARVDVIYGALGEVAHVMEQDGVDLVHDLLQVASGELALYKVFAALAVDWGLPQPARDMALIREGLALADDPSDRQLLLEQLAAALYAQGLLAELQELAEQVLAEPGPSPALQAFVCGRVGDLLRYQGQLDAGAEWLARARERDPDGADLVAFEYAYHRVRFEREGAAGEGEAALRLAWAFLEGYRPVRPFGDWLVDTASWVCLQEEARGQLDRAARALEWIRRFEPGELRWEARRLGLLARQEPYDAARLRQEVEAFRAQLAQVVRRLTQTARDERDPGRRDRDRRRSQALSELPTEALVEAADRRGDLIDGLSRLEQALAGLGAD